MNTFDLMPFEAIAINEIVDPGYPEFPGISGTGFFCYFHPHPEIYYVTARHCLVGMGLNTPDDLKVRHPSSPTKYIPFSHYLSTTGTSLKEDDLEDVLVFKVDGQHPIEQMTRLRRSALRLPNQEDVERHLKSLQTPAAGKVRVIGFPRGAEDANQIDYDRAEPLMTTQPRGFVGRLRGNSGLENRYLIVDSNWKQPSYDGFSGSPVLEIIPLPSFNPARLDRKDVLAVPLGVVLTATPQAVHFLSINIVTDLVAAAINNGFKDFHR